MMEVTVFDQANKHVPVNVTYLKGNSLTVSGEKLRYK
jgi:hypothetical protein